MTNLKSDSKAITIKKTFSRETAISINIQAVKSIVNGQTNFSMDEKIWEPIFNAV